MKIIKLSEKVISQIAAGEVIERPAAAVKELIENSLDAGATYIGITISGGGKSFIQVIDNGCGMTSEEISIAVQRHCTSKISDDLGNIRTLGFRGEALPSIGSVAQLTLISRPAVQATGTKIVVSGGKISPVRPAAANPGTIVEVRNLFFAIPARLKFLKSEQAENNAIIDVVKRIAISFPNVRFLLSGTNSSKLDFLTTDGNLVSRISQILGQEFSNNSIELNEVFQDMYLNGYVGLPTFNRSNASQQYMFVNNRSVQDKLLFSAIRAAYAETIPQRRYPVVVLLLKLDPTLVDVNVHPAKSDVRFRGPTIVRNFVIDTIRKALSKENLITSSTLTANMLSSFRYNFRKVSLPTQWNPKNSPSHPLNLTFHEQQESILVDRKSTVNQTTNLPVQDQDTISYPLGLACAQIHQNYIIAQTYNGLVIIDQHAAHEQLLFEKMRKKLNEGQLTSQTLLMPEIIDLLEEECNLIIAHAAEFYKLGLVIEQFGPGAIVVRETPELLAGINIRALIRDLLDDIIENDTTDSLFNQLEKILATMACHSSIRAGRKMQIEEMNTLLREMEEIQNSSQCNHGRPTFIELKLTDIEKLFGR